MKKIKIVFLDASTVNYGDTDLSPLAALGDLRCYDHTPPGEILQRSADADIVITNKIVFDKATMDGCSKLRLIAVAATGYNNVDVAHAAKKGIHVANVPGYSTYSVAQLTMTFILALAGNLIQHNKACHDGTWSRSQVFTLGSYPTADLEGKVLGILGMGSIGRKVASLAQAFGMKVAALRRKDVLYDDSVERLDLNRLTLMSDFISLHLPLTDYSRNLVDEEFFSNMKSSACFINMARGQIVKQGALHWALTTGEIAGAAIDVMDVEPPPADHPLLALDNLLMTPHIAWASRESRRRLISEIALNISDFLIEKKRNIVNSRENP